MRDRLRLVSWNVGRLYSRTHNNRLDDADVPAVAATLAELHPDIVLLQEIVDASQLEALRARLPPRLGAFDCAIAQACGYDRHVAVLARRERAPEFDESLLGQTSRGVVAARFDFAGAKAAALSAHFDVFSAERRAEQGEALAALAEARTESLVIVGGDLNLNPRLAARTYNQRDQRTFARLTRHFVDTGRESGATLMGLFRVDHLFLRGPGEHVMRVSPRRLPLGDHHPLVLDVDHDKT